MTCPTCNDEGTVERPATPDEVDHGCELGIAFDPCPNLAHHPDHAAKVVGPIVEGAVVLLRLNPPDELEEPDEWDERMGNIARELARVAGHKKFTVLVTTPWESVEVLDENAMRELGWTRTTTA